MALARSLLVAMLALSGSACVVVDTNAGPKETYTQDVGVGDATSVRVELRMGAGDLSITGGSGAKLLESTYRYSERMGHPEVRYDVVRMLGRLTIEAPEGRFSTAHTTNEWRLRFGDRVPLEFRVHLGAGKCDADLSGLPVRGVDIAMGAGQLVLNLAGRYSQDVDVSVQGGVGEAHITLPRDFPAVADVAGGIGSIQSDGLAKRDGRYVNPVYEEGKPAVHLRVRGGVGEIRLALSE